MSKIDNNITHLVCVKIGLTSCLRIWPMNRAGWIQVVCERTARTRESRPCAW